MVFVNGVALHQVADRTMLTSETFYYDWAKRRIFLGASPKGQQVEISSRPVALVLAHAKFWVLGLGFRKYASNEFGNTTGSALKINRAVSLVENSVFTQNAALGLTFSKPRPGTVARSNVFAVNGYTALGGNGSSAPAVATTWWSKTTSSPATMPSGSAPTARHRVGPPQ